MMAKCIIWLKIISHTNLDDILICSISWWHYSPIPSTTVKEFKILCRKVCGKGGAKGSAFMRCCRLAKISLNHFCGDWNILSCSRYFFSYSVATTTPPKPLVGLLLLMRMRFSNVACRNRQKPPGRRYYSYFVGSGGFRAKYFFFVLVVVGLKITRRDQMQFVMGTGVHPGRSPCAWCCAAAELPWQKP